MIRNRKQAMTAARATTRNEPGFCQLVTRTWFNAPSAGDQDGDGDADAVDGWLSEPLWARHENDRNPPAGVPLAWSGGRSGFGHRAISMGDGWVRSTDAGGLGIIKTVEFDFFENAWGMNYLGWSETIDGFKIPEEKKDPMPLPRDPIIDVPNQIAPKLSKKSWRGFLHLKARWYQDYRKAVVRAGHRKTRKSIDIDVQKDKNKVLWCLHWKTVGKNKLHDPKGKIKASDRIQDLTTAEVQRLRGPKGQVPRRLIPLLRLAFRLGVRVEVELKTFVGFKKIQRILARKNISKMHRQGDLQFKTLAELPGALNRLAPVQRAGGVTILSFTGYTGKGLNKKRGYAVTDFTRGNAKWN